MTKDERPSIADTAKTSEAPAEYPRLDSLERQASGRLGPAADAGGDIPAEGSYAPLADALHRSKPVPKTASKPTGLEPGDMIMKPVKRRSERDRIKALVDKTIRTSVAKGSLTPDAGAALIAGRYSQWLDEQARTANAADVPAPRRRGPGSAP